MKRALNIEDPFITYFLASLALRERQKVIVPGAICVGTEVGKARGCWIHHSDVRIVSAIRDIEGIGARLDETNDRFTSVNATVVLHVSNMLV